MSHYSDPTHALLAKIAQSVDRLSETIVKQPRAESSLLAQTLAENIRLHEALNKANEEMLVLRMDAGKDPALRNAIIDCYLNPSKKDS
jgi:hypothetical protein